MTVDYISMLGKRLNEVLINDSDYSIEYIDEYSDLVGYLGIGESIVKAKDGRYEMFLSIEKTIRVIFLFPIEDKFDGFDFEASRGRTSIIERLGTPSKSEQERVIPGLVGKKGAFDRYDYADYSIHFEYALGQKRIELITLMLPEVARRF